jgi:hypothetical protein
MRKMRGSFRVEVNLAKSLWGEIGQFKSKELRELMRRFRLTVSLGDVTYIDRHWYVTHAGLLRLASRRRCCGIKTALQRQLSDSLNNRWVFKAVVYKSPGSPGFSGYGDADPTNTSPLVRGAEMRVAETRAVNRALRKAYGIGLCSVEELGWLTNSPSPPGKRVQSAKRADSNGSNNGQPKLRDRLCVLIRQHNLDPILVKAYAADFCGTPTIKDASRDLIESFISHLAAAANENRDSLVCKLNSYSQPVEVKL